MKSNDKEIIELLRILMNSMCVYVAPRIQNDKNRFAYVRAMSRCFAVCNDLENKEDLAKIKLELLKVLREHVKTPPPRFEIFSATSKYYKLGIEHSLDVVESLTKRFKGDFPYADIASTKTILEVYSHEVKDIKYSKYY